MHGINQHLFLILCKFINFMRIYQIFKKSFYEAELAPLLQNSNFYYVIDSLINYPNLEKDSKRHFIKFNTAVSQPNQVRITRGNGGHMFIF